MLILYHFKRIYANQHNNSNSLPMQHKQINRSLSLK